MGTNSIAGKVINHTLTNAVDTPETAAMFADGVGAPKGDRRVVSGTEAEALKPPRCQRLPAIWSEKVPSERSAQVEVDSFARPR